MFEYIIPFLIFLSLGVIVYIVSKHFSDFKENQFFKKEGEIKNEKAIQKFRRIIFNGFGLLKNGFFCLAEILVKKIKQFLHLIHFWILKTKNGNSGEDELLIENKVKKELIEAEEESLEKIIEDDLAGEVSVKIGRDLEIKHQNQLENEEVEEVDYIDIKENDTKDFEREFIKADDNEVLNSDNEELSSFDNKIKSFFSDEGDKDDFSAKFVNKKNENSFFGKIGGFLNKFKREKSERNNEFDVNVQQDENVFSDGLVDVKEIDSELVEVDEYSLIKEVVPVRKKDPVDIDDEIGVDRSILEKKLIQKIANNPKDMENYRALGELYIKMKNFPDAEECYKQILKVQLRDVDAKRKLEKIKLLKRMG